jgi:hypothetical protein
MRTTLWQIAQDMRYGRSERAYWLAQRMLALMSVRQLAEHLRSLGVLFLEAYYAIFGKLPRA